MSFTSDAVMAAPTSGGDGGFWGSLGKIGSTVVDTFGKALPVWFNDTLNQQKSDQLDNPTRQGTGGAVTTATRGAVSGGAQSSVVLNTGTLMALLGVGFLIVLALKK